jgi:hypothetical protein
MIKVRKGGVRKMKTKSWISALKRLALRLLDLMTRTYGTSQGNKDDEWWRYSGWFTGEW